jgi:DNA-binding response OmpR family regulator
MNDLETNGLETDLPGVGAPVLLVDSDKEFREAFAQRMERMGCRLDSFPDPSNLEDFLVDRRPAVLVLSDDGPGISAIDLVATLRATDQWKQLPIFVVGNRLGTETALRAYGAGADAALSKTRTSDLTELTARVLGAVRRADETPGRPALTSPGGGETVPDVVVVEDDQALIEMLTYSLSNQGYDLVFYANGREALDGLLAMPTGDRRPVVLLDVDLPGLDGFRVLQELSQQRPGDFQVIMATMHSSEAAQVLAIESGALDYIVKPISIPITLAKVERLVQAGAAR